MDSRTLVCAYGKNESVERVFARLRQMYLNNYSPNYVYCAVVDLCDALSYRAAGDGCIEKKAESCLRGLKNDFGERFFCAVRQRRYQSSRCAYGYFCEGGALGALKELWRYAYGGKEVLFPVPGDVGIPQKWRAERIYFSCSGDDEKTHLNGYGCDRNEFFDEKCIRVIERRGIFKLAKELGNGVNFALDPSRGDGGLRIGEGLYSAYALNTLLAEGTDIADIERKTVQGVRLTLSPIRISEAVKL